MNNVRKMSLAVATILAAASVVVVAFPHSPSFVGCTSSEECSIDECCVLGMSRYSLPACRSLGHEGENCRPQDHDEMPHHLNMSYPDGTWTNVNVYMDVCPCAIGLECSDGMACTGLDGTGKLALREDYTDVDEINQLRR